ncbi:DUF6387 family protein [Methylomicrobium lacus]|uniref:DUF6387 family protein n=1 Tax=Methylomicrobium lacus TaxID=136992 RepID=UPI0035A8904A
MTKVEIDTSWFDLKNYEALKTMSTDGWAKALSIRHQIYFSSIESDSPCQPGRPPRTFLLKKVEALKKGVVISNENADAGLNYKVNSILNGDPFSTFSVNSLSSYELAQLATNPNLSQVWEACNHMYELDANRYDDKLSLIPDRNLTEIAWTPHDVNLRQQSNSPHPLAYVAVNLDSTNEQIIKDFDHWLTHYRKQVDLISRKNLISQKDFNHWIDYRIIPYLDLTLIAKIEGRKLTQHKLAQMIFPDEYNVDIVGRLRQVTKPEAERVMKNHIHKALSAQSVFEKIVGMKKA